MLGKGKDRTLPGLKGSEDSSEEIKGIKELQEPCAHGRKTRLNRLEVGDRMQALAHPARSSTANTTPPGTFQISNICPACSPA